MQAAVAALNGCGSSVVVVVVVDVVVALVVVVVAWAAACPAPPSSTAPATTPAATPFDTRNIPSLHLRAPGLSGRPRELWGWGLELHQRIELEARERRVGVVGRPGDEVREVALCANRERIQELVLDADSGPLHVRSGRAEVAEREGRDGGLLPQVLVE